MQQLHHEAELAADMHKEMGFSEVVDIQGYTPQEIIDNGKDAGNKRTEGLLGHYEKRHIGYGYGKNA